VADLVEQPLQEVLTARGRVVMVLGQQQTEVVPRPGVVRMGGEVSLERGDLLVEVHRSPGV